MVDIRDHGGNFGGGIDKYRLFPSYSPGNIKMYLDVETRPQTGDGMPVACSKSYYVMTMYGANQSLQVYDRKTKSFLYTRTIADILVSADNYAYYGLKGSHIVNDRYLWVLGKTLILVYDLTNNGAEVYRYQPATLTGTSASLWYSESTGNMYMTNSARELFEFSTGSSPSLLRNSSVQGPQNIIGIIFENDKYFVMTQLDSDTGYLAVFNKSTLTYVSSYLFNTKNVRDNQIALTVDNNTFITAGYRNSWGDLRKFSIASDGTITMPIQSFPTGGMYFLYKNTKNQFFIFNQTGVFQINPSDLTVKKKSNVIIPVDSNYNGKFALSGSYNNVDIVTFSKFASVTGPYYRSSNDNGASFTIYLEGA